MWYVGLFLQLRINLIETNSFCGVFKNLKAAVKALSPDPVGI